MSFVGNFKDLFGLNKSKKDERTKLDRLADQIQNFIKTQSNYLNDSDATKGYNEFCILYATIAYSLYTIISEIYGKRKDGNSKLAQKLDSSGVFKDSKFNIIAQNIQKSSIEQLVRVKDDKKKKYFMNIIYNWLQKFKNVKGGHFTVWTNKIKKAIADLNKIDIQETANVFIKKINEKNLFATIDNIVRSDKKKLSMDNLIQMDYYDEDDKKIIHFFQDDLKGLKSGDEKFDYINKKFNDIIDNTIYMFATSERLTKMKFETTQDGEGVEFTLNGMKHSVEVNKKLLLKRGDEMLVFEL